MNGIIKSGANNSFVVISSDDGQEYRCSIKGKKLDSAKGFYNPLAAGDNVTWDKASPGTGVIIDLVPRRNCFWRYNEKGKAIQIIAANIDQVICVCSCALPPFRPRFIDRASLEPVASGLPFIIALNKTDLGIDDETEKRINDYKQIGFTVIELSCENDSGIAQLHELIKGKTSAFVGQSGVGKSSILNKLESGLGMKVGEVCEKYERGRHTTVMSVYLELKDGQTKVIDTPGIRRLAVRGIDPFSLYACFPEIAKIASACELGQRCMHLDEPGCAVSKAVEMGQIHSDRYESYVRILSELQDTKTYAKKAGRPRKIYYDYED